MAEQYDRLEQISAKYTTRLDFREAVYPYVLLIKANTEFVLLTFCECELVNQDL